MGKTVTVALCGVQQRIGTTTQALTNGCVFADDGVYGSLC